MSTGAEIVISIHDVTAREDSNPVCDGVRAFAAADNLKQVRQGELPSCGTLEKDFFRLDGSFAPFPDRPQGSDWGMWSSSMSGGDCRFATPPILRIGFGQKHSSIGLTLHFYEREQDYCSHLRIRWLDGVGNILAAKDFHPREALIFLMEKVEGYCGLEITFLETSKPYRYLKLAGLDYGMELHLGGRELASAVMLEEIDPTGSAVSINTLDFTVHSPLAEFSPLNPNGYFSVLQQRQRLSVSATIDGRKMNMGDFFLDRWEADGKDNIKLHAVDAVGLMDKVQYYGGIYENAPPNQVLQSVFASTGAEYVIDGALSQKKLNGYIGICTARQALGQIALALGGIVDCSRTDRVKICTMPQKASVLIDINRKFGGQRIWRRPPVTGIDIVTHKFVATDERYGAFDETLEAGTHTLLFTEPTHTPMVTGATVAAYSANHIVLTVPTTGRVTVSGGKYLHSKRGASDNLAEQGANIADNRLKVESATMLGAENAQDILTRLRDCCMRGLSTEFSVKLGAERVADMVMIKSIDGESIRGVIESMETDLTGGCLCKMRISAQRIVTVSVSYAGEIYAGQNLGVL